MYSKQLIATEDMVVKIPGMVQHQNPVGQAITEDWPQPQAADEY